MDAILNNLIKVTIADATLSIRLRNKSEAIGKVGFLFGLLSALPHNDPRVVSLCYNGVKSMRDMATVRTAFNLVTHELNKVVAQAAR